MLNGRISGALFVLVWFAIWAGHVATGFLDGLIAAHSGRTSTIVRGLDTVTHALLVRPLGRPLAALMLIAIGIGLAVFLSRPNKDRAQ